MADRYAAKIVPFQFKPHRTIAGNWAKIRDYRQRVINSNIGLKSAYNDNVLCHIFVKAHPDAYRLLLDSLKPRSITEAEKLAYLCEKEGELNPQGDDSDVEEAGHLARHGGGKYRGRGNARSAGRKSVQGNQSRRRRDSSASSTASALICYLCKDSKTPCAFIECLDLLTAQMLLGAYKNEAAKKASRRGTAKSSSKSNRAYAANSAEDSDAAQIDFDASASNDEDTTNLTASDISKADTGATSHMSDQPTLPFLVTKSMSTEKGQSWRGRITM